jgi:hypothetical protein
MEYNTAKAGRKEDKKNLFIFYLLTTTIARLGATIIAYSKAVVRAIFTFKLMAFHLLVNS